MWVPLAVKGKKIGALGVAHEKRDYFTLHHADLALSVANQTAITMVNAELIVRWAPARPKENNREEHI